ncbi:MAG TPA: ammonium transporter [Planctomycetota bacterium]|nr:ammonium transporter [Planctomycetota bacterium]
MLFAFISVLHAAEGDHPSAPADAHALPDPSGSTAGKDFGPNYLSAAKPGDPTLPELAQQTTRIRYGMNLMWTLLCGFLVFFMQAGFALLETGFTRRKNAAHTMLMNLMVFCIGLLGYYICGFAMMFGGSNKFPLLDGLVSINGWNVLGKKGFFLNGLFDSQIMGLFLFQMVFMDTAATIPTGAMAERLKFSAFIWMSFFLTMVTYPLVGNWVWGGGWLSQLGEKWSWGHGAIDFSGSGVIHMVGGITALVGAWVLGPRIGKYDKNGNPRPIPGHNIPMAMLGTFILFFGWFGFNAGSTNAATEGIISVAAVNTLIAGALGGFSAMIYMMKFHPARKPDPGLCCNGLLAGLVAVTAPCAYISPTGAVIVGLIAGVLSTWGGEFVERTMKVDDCVGAFAIHGLCGMWGVLSVGLFATGTYGAGFNHVAHVTVAGKEFSGGVLGLMPFGAPVGTPWGYTGQLMAQIFYAMVVFIFVFAIQLAFFRLYHKKWGLRVSADDELQGLDIPETGCPAYADF